MATWTHFLAPVWQNCLIPTTIPATLGVPPDQGAREREMRELKRELLGEGQLLQGVKTSMGEEGRELK